VGRSIGKDKCSKEAIERGIDKKGASEGEL